MPKITVNEFADIVAAAGGTPKYNKVQLIKQRRSEKYSPATDFYKPIRDQIKLLHQDSLGPDSLEFVLEKISPKKRSNYHDIIRGYKSWLKKTGKTEWFEPASNIWSASKVDVNVNPELGLVIDGVPYLIKLHFNAEKLSKSRADVITFLMNEALPAVNPGVSNMCVLDIRESRLYDCNISNPKRLNAALLGEIAYISAVW